MKAAKERIKAILKNIPEFADIELIRQDYETGEILDLERITNDAVRLSVLLIRIGSISVELMAKANYAYIYRKRRYIFEFTALTAVMHKYEKDAIAGKKIVAEQEEEVISRFVADHFKTYYDDISRFISVLQTKIKTITSERIQAAMDVKLQSKEY